MVKVETKISGFIYISNITQTLFDNKQSHRRGGKSSQKKPLSQETIFFLRIIYFVPHLTGFDLSKMSFYQRPGFGKFFFDSIFYCCIWNFHPCQVVIVFAAKSKLSSYFLCLAIHCCCRSLL